MLHFAAAILHNSRQKTSVNHRPSTPVFCRFTGVPWYNTDTAEPRRFQPASEPRQHKRTPIRQRQFRGLVLHHRRHPSDHPRRLVNRTARWKEPPQNGVCRWCYEPTAHIRTRWHSYCLNAYRVASGQHPEEIQKTLCKMCGSQPDEIDHRLAIKVARALGPAAMLRAFTPGEPALAVPRVPPTQDQTGQAACEVSYGLLARMVRRPPSAEAEPQLGAVVSAALQPGSGPA